jgi:hypothetical protein
MYAMTGYRVTEHASIGPFSNRSHEWVLCCPDSNQNFGYDVKLSLFREIWDHWQLNYLFIIEIASSVILLFPHCYSTFHLLSCGYWWPSLFNYTVKLVVQVADVQ